MSSSINSSSTPLPADTAFTGQWEFLSSEKHGVQAICSTDAAGTLLIEFSQNKIDINYTHTFDIEADVSFARSVKKKGNYYRTILNNGPNPQTTLQLVSIIETDFEPDTLDVTLDAATSSITMFGTDDTGTKRAVKTTSTGELVVSGGGGGGGGDASASNQETQIQIAEDTLLSVDGINTKLNSLQLQSARYTIEAASSLAPDTTPTFKIPPTGIEKSEGWYFKNTAVSQPSQVYYYSYTNPALQVPARQFAYELGSIALGYAVVRILSINASMGLPTLAIYTRPTGSGDAFPGYYKSKKVYSIPATAKLTQGMRVMLWWGTITPHLKLHPDVVRIQLELSSTVGTAASTEELAYLTVNTDSAALAGNSEYILSAAGFEYGGELIMDSTFTGESSQSETFTNSNLHVRDDYLTSQVINLSTNIGNGVYTLMDTIPAISGGVRLTGFTNGNLFVYDAASKSQLEDINTSLNEFKNGTSEIWVHTQAADDSIEIHGYNTTLSAPEYIESVDHSAKVYVNNVVDSLLLAKNPVDNNVSLLTDVDQRLLISSIITGSVAVTGDFYQATQPVEGTVSANVKSGDVPITYTDFGTIQALDIAVKNASIAVTGEFWQTTQPVSIEHLAFTAQDELITYDDYTFQELQTLNGKVTKCDTDNVTISGTVPISSGSPLDTHIYGSSDGTTWHHIKTNPNGVVSTNAIMETDANGALTSTAVSGTETYNALDTVIKNSTLQTVLRTQDNGQLTSTLSGTGNSVHSLDVAVKNNVSVQNVSSTQLAIKVQQFGSYNNLVNNETIGPYSAGSQVLDISNWSYITGYYTDVQGSYPSYPDVRRLEFSFDGITWYRLFNLQISPSQQGAINVASIYKQDVPGINYVRFYNDTNLTLASVNCTILGATCT